MVLKQLETGLELVHCHVTLTLETFITSAVTSVGVGGAEVIQTNYSKLDEMLCNMYIPLAGRETIPGSPLVSFTLPMA